MSQSPDRLRVFAYVDAEKAGLYRAVMRAFMRARDGFRLHLRPGDVREALAPQLTVDASEVDAALAQLCIWENLVALPDSSDVATVEEFYRPRFFFQLSARGEAAERAVAWFEDSLRRPGELQTAALHDIRVHLSELVALARAQGDDPGKVHRVLVTLRARFDELTDRAQAFMGSLQRRVDLHGIDLDAFRHYKQRLIEYLERFIGELVIATSEIAGLIAEVEAAGIDRLLLVTAERELVDRLERTDDEVAQALAAWQSRWAGLRGWFVGEGARPSQAEVLRARARSAIPSLLAALAAIHDRRVTRTDRAQDFRTLARWFAHCPDDDAAHRLWRAAFGLAPARHLSIDAATLEARDQHPVAASASWLNAPPLQISPRLRATGRHTRKGRANSVIDRSEAKRALSGLAKAEAAQIAAAQARLAGSRQVLLSQIGALGRAEFDLLLDLLGEALALYTGGDRPVETVSSDGTLRIALEPARCGRASIATADGVLHGPDFRVTIEPTFREQREEVA